MMRQALWAIGSAMVVFWAITHFIAIDQTSVRFRDVDAIAKRKRQERKTNG